LSGLSRHVIILRQRRVSPSEPKHAKECGARAAGFQRLTAGAAPGECFRPGIELTIFHAAFSRTGTLPFSIDRTMECH
jgi:hypothetical protein